MDSNSQVQSPETEQITKKPRQLLKTALLMGGSALLGGLAVAIFNRKQIETIRQNRETSPGLPDRSGPEEEI